MSKAINKSLFKSILPTYGNPRTQIPVWDNSQKMFICNEEIIRRNTESMLAAYLAGESKTQNIAVDTETIGAEAKALTDRCYKSFLDADFNTRLTQILPAIECKQDKREKTTRTDKKIPTTMENLQIDTQNKEQMLAYELIANTNSSFFLTGQAGTGKTTFLRNVQQTVDKNFVTVAFTGVAAIQAGGETIHSFFGLPMEVCGPGTLGKLNEARAQTIRHADTIIIDEVSMLRCDIVDAIDYTLRKTMKNTRPFGGKQVVFVGDLFQLPPIVNKGEQRELLTDLYHTYNFFFYKANVIKRMRLVKIEFRKVYRQDNKDFLHTLDNVRMNRICADDLMRLNRYVRPIDETDSMIITLTAQNSTADEINRKRLDGISSKEYVYEGCVNGKFEDKKFPVEMRLRLKVGAQVMFTRNDPQRRWVNGTLAKVTKLADDEISVTLDSGDTYNVPLCTWESVKYTYDKEQKRLTKEVIGEFVQYPLRLAWAITIHKSQGMSFDKMALNLNRNLFTNGQLYVALSRVRSLDGLYLSRCITTKDAHTEREILAYAGNFNDAQTIDNEIESGKAVYQAMRDNDYDEAARQYLMLVKSKAESGDTKEAIQQAKRMLDTMVSDEHLYGCIDTIPETLAANMHWTGHFITALLALYANHYEMALEAAEKVLDCHECQEAMYVKSRCLAKLERYKEADEVNVMMSEKFCMDTPDAKVLYMIAIVNELHIGDQGLDLMRFLIMARPGYDRGILTMRMLMKRHGITLESKTENSLADAFNSDMRDEDFATMLKEQRKKASRNVSQLIGLIKKQNFNEIS